METKTLLEEKPTQDSTELIERTKEITKAANDIKIGMKAFEKRKSELTELAEKGKGLEIKDLDDKKGIEEVSKVRKELKNARTTITNEGKDMRAPLTRFSKWIIEKEKELVDIVEPVEIKLKKKEDWVEAEKERIKEEERKREEEKINSRINSLAELGFKIDYSELKVMTDEEFEELLNEAQELFQQEEEKKRLEEERQLKIEERKQTLFDMGMNYSGGSNEFRHIYAINHTITLDAIEAASDGVFDAMVASAKQSIEAEKKRQEAERQKREDERAELERLKKEADEREAKLKAEREKIEAEKIAIEQAKQIQKAKEEAAEKARKEAIVEAKRKEAEKLEKERKAKERAERKAAMAPDKDKIVMFLNEISQVPVPDVKSEEANKLIRGITDRILKDVEWAHDMLKQLGER